MYLMILKITIDFAIMIDSPNAANNVWIAEPVPTPNDEMIPAFFPCVTLLLKISKVSFPGVMINKKPAIAKAKKWVIPNM